MLSRLLAPTLAALVLFGTLVDSSSVLSGAAAAAERGIPNAAPMPKAPSTLKTSDDGMLPIYVVSDVGPDSNHLVRYDEEVCSPSRCKIDCKESKHFWVRGEYLIWWTKGSNSPPLVTTSPDGTPLGEAGVLGNSATEVLFPNGSLNGDARSGYRISAGLWRSACRKLAIEADFWDLGANTTNFVASGDGSPILARPFYDTSTKPNKQNASLISFDGAATPGWRTVTGTVTVNASDYFQSAGAWLTYNLKTCKANYCYRLDMLAGYRHYRYNDNLSIHGNSNVSIKLTRDGSPLANAIVDQLDSFHTHNDFHGCELGVKAQVRRGCWSLNLLAKAAFGNTHQVITISGETTRTIPPLTPTTTPGGLLTSDGGDNGDGNLGQFSRDRFAVIPQFGAELGYELTCHWRAFAGYNFLYWANVQRAGSQIDFNVDPSDDPPAGANPVPQLTNTDFWAQGVNVGLECRY